jgi:hypothetical protein
MERTMRRYRPLAASGAALLCLALSGCANFWEDITSRDFKFKNLYTRDDPLVVLRDSNDGDKRARAMMRLTEPKANGGDDKTQNLVFEILSKTATTDPQPLCRLVAIDKLGHFKDPRAAKALEAAYYAVDTIPTQFADLTTRIQCHVLAAMGNVHNPEVVPFLAQVLKEPPADRSDEAHRRNDRCMAAARSLGQYPEKQAAEALFVVLEERKADHKKEDIALRDVAGKSLRDITGKDFAGDADAWDIYLHPGSDTALAKAKEKEKDKDKGSKINLVGWFTHSN